MNTVNDKKIELNNFSELLRLPKEQALEKMYDHYAPVLYGITLKIVRSESLAEEILKQSFQQIWKDSSSFALSNQNPILWMIGIVRCNALKKIPFNSYLQNHTTSFFVDKDENTKLPDEKAFRINDNRNSLLTPEQNKILNLIFFGGGKINEVATHLSMEESKVKILLREAIHHYRKSKTI